MRLVILGATGRIGQQIALEGHNRGHVVTGISRGISPSAELPPLYQIKHVDIFEPGALQDVLQNKDALISAYRSPAKGSPTVVDAAIEIVHAAADVGVNRMIFVSGAGAVEISPGVLFCETTGFPESLKSLSLAHRAVCDLLSETADFRWTVMSPAVEIGPGEKRGGLKISTTFVQNPAIRSCISYADFAIAVVNELEEDQHIGKLISASYT